MGCKYCKEYKKLHERDEHLSHKGDFHPGIEVIIDGRLLGIGCAPDTYEPCFVEADIEINFCPMCGDKLEEE